MANWPAGGTGTMFRHVAALPEQMAAGVAPEQLAAVANLEWESNRIVLCGMGGSAIAGDLVQPLLSATQLHVWRDYGLPRWATADDLVITVSYSGHTEEALSGWAEAGRRGCHRLAVTSGGALAEAAARAAVPLISLPPGLPPRAALGYGLGALVRALGVLGPVPDAREQLAEAVAVLRAGAARGLAPYGEPHAGEPDGPGAREVAELLRGRLAVIQTAGDEAHGAGLRFKGQLNENAKVPALLASYPELDHNDVVGWNLDPADRGRYVLLILTGNRDHDRLNSRVAATRELLADQFPVTHEVAAAGRGALARVVSLVQFGDCVSCHLADLRGVDALPVVPIEKLKRALADVRTTEEA